MSRSVAFYIIESSITVQNPNLKNVGNNIREVGKSLSHVAGAVGNSFRNLYKQKENQSNRR